jgi:hypothetical protein
LLKAYDRLHWRYIKSTESHSENLLFSTLDMTPDDTSIFHLTDRPSVVLQSETLLSGELAAARKLLDRF